VAATTVAELEQSPPQEFRSTIPCSIDIVGDTLRVASTRVCRCCKPKGLFHHGAECPVRRFKTFGMALPGFAADGQHDLSAWRQSNYTGVDHPPFGSHTVELRPVGPRRYAWSTTTEELPAATHCGASESMSTVDIAGGLSSVKEGSGPRAESIDPFMYAHGYAESVQTLMFWPIGLGSTFKCLVSSRAPVAVYTTRFLPASLNSGADQHMNYRGQNWTRKVSIMLPK
jgi:hypothetical protein